MKKIRNTTIALMTLCILMIVCLKFNDVSHTTVENKTFNAPAYYTETKNSTISLQWNPGTTSGTTYNISIHYVDENGNPIFTDAELQKLITDDDKDTANKKLPVIAGTDLYLDKLNTIETKKGDYSWSHVLFGSFEDGIRIKKDIYTYVNGSQQEMIYYNVVDGVHEGQWDKETEVEMPATSDIYIVYNRFSEYSVKDDKYTVDWKVGSTNYKINISYIDVDGNVIIADDQLKEEFAKDLDTTNLPHLEGTNLIVDKLKNITTSAGLGEGYYYDHAEIEIDGERIKTKQYIYSYANGEKSNKLFYNIIDGVNTGVWDEETEKEMPQEVDVYIVYQPYPYYTVEDDLYEMKWYVNNNNLHTFKIHFVDESGREIISGKDIFDSAPRKTNLVDYWLNTTKEITAKNGKKYVFKNARLENGQFIKPVIHSIFGTNNLYYGLYNGNNIEEWTVFPGLENDVYLVYIAKNESNKVETVDNYAAGLDMYMFNYTYDQIYSLDGGYKYGVGNLTQGLYSKVLDENGYPVVASTGMSLEPLFNKKYGVQANNLFIKKVYDAEDTAGTLYYSSNENFASFNEKTGKFQVYNAVGSPSGEDHFFYQRGNFMPYNTLDLTNVVNYNWYNEFGQKLNQNINDKTYSKEIYGFKEENDYYFGLYGVGKFVQRESNSPDKEPASIMISGDDDYLVYIDDVLVIDLGGVHDAQSAYLDLDTGLIKWSDKEQTVDDPMISTTSLKEIYNNLDDEELKQKLAAKGWSGTEDTFAANSEHEIKIFYMERGAAATTFEINLNLDLVKNKPSTSVENPSTGDNVITEAILPFAVSAVVLGVAICLTFKKIKKS